MSSAKNEINKSRRQQFVTFSMEGSLYGVDILTVKEVSSDYNLTPIYHAPDTVKGYVNLRGEIYLILDLTVALGFENSLEKKSKLIIFKNIVDDPFGIIVNTSGDVVSIEEDQFQKFNSSDTKNNLNTLHDKQIINGLFKTENNLIISIDAYKILSILDEEGVEAK